MTAPWWALIAQWALIIGAGLLVLAVVWAALHLLSGE
jgi:hypothetical protein